MVDVNAWFFGTHITKSEIAMDIPLKVFVRHALQHHNSQEVCPRGLFANSDPC